MEITIDYNLSCTSHEEAGTKIVRHVQHFDSTIWIRCSDTDVLIIMLRNIDSFVQIYMKIGVVAILYKCYININKLYDILGKSLCMSLPGFHAFTSCD